MKILKRAKQEKLLEYAERISELYTKTYNTKARKLKGQFFTPGKISTFMASLFDIHHNEIRFLDPGAGTGVLTAAFCEQLLKNNNKVNLTIDVYENDPSLLPFLKSVLESCKTELKERGHYVRYNIYGQDFILHNERYFRKSHLLWTDNKHILYDFVISNPPYYKLNKDSPQSIVMMELISGQPNIYALFMTLSARMLKPEGEMVFITPRSFCSGLYYKKFREWFLNNVHIINIHIFESRKEIFDNDEVLQENIIIKARKFKKTSKQKEVVISTSKNKHFRKLSKTNAQYNDVICNKNSEIVIRIPTSPLDIDILHIVDAWPNTLDDLGLEISTGPVVPFRTEKYLLPELTERQKSVPLLWMHNMQDMKVMWPLQKNKKASAFLASYETMRFLLPVKNYVLVKRFSSKEQKRRLYAAVLLESEFPHKKIGIENHINYIYKPIGNLSVYEAFGIAALLNTTIVDNFFRSFNGNTQVNATDIRNLPFPEIEDIRKIGKSVYESQSYRNGYDLDKKVTDILGVNVNVVKNLNRCETKDE
ncbi:tRNA1(Val) (adenine(37)-N6)-methyltransferase [subsurface metagenome]